VINIGYWDFGWQSLSVGPKLGKLKNAYFFSAVIITYLLVDCIKNTIAEVKDDAKYYSQN
jgi:hypothetical protein